MNYYAFLIKNKGALHTLTGISLSKTSETYSPNLSDSQVLVPCAAHPGQVTGYLCTTDN